MIRGVDHIGIAVRRIEEALPRYEALGLRRGTTEEVPGQGVRALFISAGTTDLELLESLTPDGVIARFIERRGEGLHHVALGVDDVSAEIARLRREGFDLIDGSPRIGARGRPVAFVHPRALGGVLIELIGGPTPDER